MIGNACLHKKDELEFALEQQVNDIDHKYEYSQSSQEPHGPPEGNNYYDCQNQQKQVLDATLDSHVLNNVVLQ